MTGSRWRESRRMLPATRRSARPRLVTSAPRTRRTVLARGLACPADQADDPAPPAHARTRSPLPPLGARSRAIARHRPVIVRPRRPSTHGSATTITPRRRTAEHAGQGHIVGSAAIVSSHHTRLQQARTPQPHEQPARRASNHLLTSVPDTGASTDHLDTRSSGAYSDRCWLPTFTSPSRQPSPWVRVPSPAGSAVGE